MTSSQDSDRSRQGDADQAHQTDESYWRSLLHSAAEGIFEIARRRCGL